MNLEALRIQAQKEAREFLENDREYRMGYVDAEKPHPLTRRLSQTYAKSTQAGVRMLLSVDREMSLRAEKTLAGKEFAAFADRVRRVIAEGGRVIWSGCGSSGRLSMRLEQSWRNAIAKLSAQYPQAADALRSKLESVGNIMTGGDYAIIRAAESFEDSTLLGCHQTKLWELGEKDLLIGVTATGETTSILGTAGQALSDGAAVYMLICSDPEPLLEKMGRTRNVYSHPNCFVMYLPCGPMGLTGSTRMQSSSFEQFAGAVALEGALYDILQSCGIDVQFPGYAWYGNSFAGMTAQLMSDQAVQMIAEASDIEQSVYEAGGLMTLYADEYLMDVLTDTTERAPTFSTPPFCNSDMKEQPLSWAFVKNPACETEEAWNRCFLRQPRCIEWGNEVYASLGFRERDIQKIPDVSRSALQKFIIGKEPMPEREQGVSCALWVDAKAAPLCFREQAVRYASSGEFTLEKAGIQLPETNMDLLEHLCLKMMLNVLSTGVMARMGRITGNWMTNLAMSNKKLIDRSARIVSDLCQVPYEEALEELFYAKASAEARGVLSSPVGEVIRKLGVK